MLETEQNGNLSLTERVNFYFKEFCKQVPRRSANEKAAADYIVEMAEGFKAKGYVTDVITQYVTNDAGRPIHNVIVKKKATPDQKDNKPIILQAHMDMVCEPKQSEKHNFDTDEIVTYEEDGWVKATKIGGENGEKFPTTLGADDGIGVACILAILEADPEQEISHPPIEAVFTSDEEAEMSGAEYLIGHASELSAKRMINIDTEQEGMFFNGCAGGINLTSQVDLELWVPNTLLTQYSLSVTGLLGGHSGLMIGERRANANRLMGRVLDRLQEKLGECVFVSDIRGGEYPNAIPNSCTAAIAIREDLVSTLQGIVDEMRDAFMMEYKGTDAAPDRYEGEDRNKGLHLNLDAAKEAAQFMTPDSLGKVITLLTSLPNGVLDMHSEFPKDDGDDLVETSSNMGIVRLIGTEDKQPVFEVVCFARSCFESKKYLVERQIKRIAGYVGANVKCSSNFPAWAPNGDSPIKHALERIYFAEFGEDAVTKSIHAGLECGYLIKAIPGLDCIAIGPTILGAHTIEERLEKATVEKIVLLLVRALRDIDKPLEQTKNFKAAAKQRCEKHLECQCMR